MYPQYPDTPEGHARESLEHPHGEEYPGQYDHERQILRESDGEDYKYGENTGPG